MKNLLYALVLISLLVVWSCQRAAAPVAISNKPISINGIRQPDAPSKPVAQMSWTGTDGSEQRMQDLADKVVILDFWATYCPPCREEIPHLNSLQARYGTDKLQVIGLNVGGDEDRPKVPSFVNELKISYPIAYPEDALISFIFASESTIPQTAVFDRQGRLVVKVVGFDPEIRVELDRAVESAFKR